MPGLRGVTAECVAVKEATVARRLSDLGSAIDMLEGRLSNLSDRLTVVSINTPVNATLDKEAPRAPQSAIADHLDRMTNRINQLAEGVSIMVGNLEI